MLSVLIRDAASVRLRVPTQEAIAVPDELVCRQIDVAGSAGNRIHRPGNRLALGHIRIEGNYELIGLCLLPYGVEIIVIILRWSDSLARPEQFFVFTLTIAPFNKLVAVPDKSVCCQQRDSCSGILDFDCFWFVCCTFIVRIKDEILLIVGIPNTLRLIRIIGILGMCRSVRCRNISGPVSVQKLCRSDGNLNSLDFHFAGFGILASLICVSLCAGSTVHFENAGTFARNNLCAALSRIQWAVGLKGAIDINDSGSGDILPQRSAAGCIANIDDALVASTAIIAPLGNIIDIRGLAADLQCRAIGNLRSCLGEQCNTLALHRRCSGFDSEGDIIVDRQDKLRGIDIHADIHGHGVDLRISIDLNDQAVGSCVVVFRETALGGEHALLGSVLPRRCADKRHTCAKRAVGNGNGRVNKLRCTAVNRERNLHVLNIVLCKREHPRVDHAD